MRLMGDLWRWIQQRALARVGKNALSLFAAQAGRRLLALVLSIQLTRHLGAAGLGRYLLATTTAAVALAILDLGLNVLAVRELARESAPEEKEPFWSAVLGLKVLTACGGIALLNGLVAPLLFPDERRLLILIASLALLPDSISGAAQSLVRARQRMEVNGAVTLLAGSLAAGAGILLLQAGGDERAVLIASLVASVLEAALFLVLLRSWKVRIRWRESVARWGRTLRQAVPFAASALAAILYMRLDFLLLSYWQGNLATGVYGTAYRLWEALGMLPASLLDALFPELARQASHAQGVPRLQGLYRRGSWALVALVALVVTPCFLLAPNLVRLLYGAGPGMAEAADLFRVFLAVTPLTYLYLFNGHVLYAIGRQRFVTAALAAVTLLNGLLNAAVIWRWSFWGAAGVACLTETALFVALWGGAQRFLVPRGPARGREVEP
jgi:O-antigen/teichoic acid export membrane protein